MRKSFSVLLALTLLSANVCASPSPYTLLAMLSPVAPYQIDNTVEWRRYLHLPDGTLVATTDAQWQPQLERCLTMVWHAPEDVTRQHWLDRQRLVYEGKLFGIDKDEIFTRSINIDMPDGIDPIALMELMVTDPWRAGYENIAQDEHFKRCVRQRTGASLTGITLPFSKDSGEQLAYQPDSKDYRPATVSVDRIRLLEAHQQNEKWLPEDSSVPSDASRYCSRKAFDGLAFSDDAQRDIAFLKRLYYRSFKLYTFKQNATKNTLSLSENVLRQRHTEDFLASQPPLLQLANTAIERYDHCLQEDYRLNSATRPIFIDDAGKAMFKPALHRHSFIKIADLPQQVDLKP